MKSDGKDKTQKKKKNRWQQKGVDQVQSSRVNQAVRSKCPNPRGGERREGGGEGRSETSWVTVTEANDKRRGKSDAQRKKIMKGVIRSTSA